MKEREKPMLGMLQAEGVEDALKTMLASTEEYLDAFGWDQPGQVFTIHVIPEVGLDVRTAPALSNTIGTDVHSFLPLIIRELNNPDSPYREEGRHALSHELMENFYGLMLFVEAWCVTEPRPGAGLEEWESVEEARKSRTLHLHPDRKELRMGIFVSVDGRLVHVQRFRGEEPWEPKEESGVLGGTSAEYHGEVPKNLYQFVQICAEVAPSCRFIS